MAGTRKGALKAWRTMRSKDWKRKNAAKKAWRTIRKNKLTVIAKKAWRTRRANGN